MNHQKSNRDCEKQKMILTKFRQNLSDALKPQHTDSYLLKWLRSRHFDLEKAEELLRLNLRLRDFYQLDNILTDFEIPEVLATYGGLTFLGFDKEGSPIRFSTWGTVDVDGILRSVCPFQSSLYAVYAIESDIHALQERNRRTGKSCENVLYIVDMSGLNLQMYLQQHIIEVGLDILPVLQDLYPEHFKAIIIINAPIYFYIAYNVFKPVMKREVTDRIKVFSEDKDSWRDYLFTLIDAEVLPEMLGGTSNIIINTAGKIPPERYVEPKTELPETDAGVKSVKVAPLATFDLSKVITKPKSTILMEFRTENYSIGFSAFYKELDLQDGQIPPLDDIQLPEEEFVDFVTLSPKLRIPSHLVNVKIKFQCTKPGMYVFRFDNLNSLFWSRKLIYKTTVNEPPSY